MNYFIGVFFLLLSFWDIRFQKVPLWILTAGCVVMLLGAGIGKGPDAEYSKIFMGMIPGILFLFLGKTTHTVGYADGLALLSLGAVVGWMNCLVLVGISTLLLSVCSLALMLCKKIRLNSKMPYLPFLCGAYIMQMLSK